MKRSTRLHNWVLLFDRTFSEKIWWQIVILLAFVVVALLIGLVVCYFLQFGDEGSKVSFYEWAVYLLVDSNALNSIYTDDYPEGGRGWVVFFSLVGSLFGAVLFGGMLISVLSNMLGRRIENYREGRNTYVIGGHYVIIGWDEIVPSLIKGLCSDGESYVLLQSSLESEYVTGRIRTSIAQDCARRVIVKHGDGRSRSDLGELRLNESRGIYVVGNRNELSHDAMNIDCLEKIYEILSVNESKGLPERVTGVFEMEDTYAALQVVDLFKNIRDLGVEFVPYNFYADWARQLFVDGFLGAGVSYPLIDGGGITEDDERHVHMVVVGTSNFGVVLGIEAAKVLHFPNFSRGRNLTRITFIDLNAERERRLFMTRYRHFFEVQSHWYNGVRYEATKFKGEKGDFLDVEFEFIEGDVFSAEVQELLADWAKDESQLLSLFFAMRDSGRNLSIAMNLPDVIYERSVPVFVRQESSSVFLRRLREKSGGSFRKLSVEGGVVKEQATQGRYANMYAFGMTDIEFDVDRRAQYVAECINHLYSKCKELDRQRLPLAEEVKNCSWEEIHRKWVGLSVADQWSNLYCAYNIAYRIHTIKAMRGDGGEITEVNAEEAELLGRVEHDRWNVEKLLLGYRKPSEEEDYYWEGNMVGGKRLKAMKDAHKELKIHCDIRPYTDLDEIQEIDKEIIRYIPWFLEMARERLKVIGNS